MQPNTSTLFKLSSFILSIFCVLTLHSQSQDTVENEKPRFIQGIDYILIDDDKQINSAALALQSSTLISGRIYDSLIYKFQMPEQTSNEAVKRINAQYNWYKRHPEYMQRVWSRADLYLFHITQELQKRNMPMELALLPIVESAFDAFAYSHGRAAGLWQIIPGTGTYLGVKQNWWYDGRRDVLDSTDAALDYLESLHRQFNGDWMLAVAAYNSGAGNVRKGIRKNKRKNLPTDFWSLHLPYETKAYVPKLLALKKLFQENSTRELLPAIANGPHFQVVETGSQIDLATAAALAEIDINTLYQLNPGFNHWATAPKGPHRLLIPNAHADIFRTGLSTLPNEQRIKLVRYKVKSGDTISDLARRNKTSIQAIREANGLRNNNLRADKYILIPQASTNLSAYTKSKDSRLNKLQSRDRRGNKLTYQVHSGDSFWSIAKNYGVSIRQIAAWNGMAPRDTLKVGQNLVIWTKNKNTNSTLRTSTANTTKRIHYTVRRGDTLSGIAKKFKVKTSQLKAWNSKKLKKYLSPGQVLTIMVDVRKQTAS